MNERWTVLGLSLFTLLALLVAPWGALGRELGARSAVLLLPDRVVDFTGRTEALTMPQQTATLLLSGVALAGLAGASFLSRRTRQLLWLVTGMLLIGATLYGLRVLGDSVATAQEAALAAGANPRRLPYSGAGMGLGAFLCLLVGGLAVLYGLRVLPRLARPIDAGLRAVAVPAVSIALALVASAAVILLIQPTPVGRNVEITGPLMALVGRLDTVYYAYVTLFADSLGTLPGFFEALKFTTPLILTGLAVAFAFQVGLFNIGAPGQMVLGGIFAMLAGVYLPGPRFVVLPLAVAASALGGGLWGALPGWLKARFGANEVINTILLNYIAASLLLFVLSSRQVFAAPALRIIVVIGLCAGLAILGSLITPLRSLVVRAPRLTFALVGMLFLVAVVVAGLPQAGDGPVNLGLPFKAPGSEPKSYPLSAAARFPHLPALLGINVSQNPGTNTVPVDYGLLIAPVVALLALWGLPRMTSMRSRAAGVLARLGGAAMLGTLAYAVAWLLGLSARPTPIPPTSLNGSFLIALAAAALVHGLLFKTRWGFELRAVGLSPKAAEYGGASISRSIIVTMTISGALAGLTACHYVLGGALEDYALRQSLPTSDGFDGIAVALLGGNTPVGVVLSAFLFGVLKNGGSVLNITFSNLTRDVVSMILALVVLFIAARGFLPERLTNPLRRVAPTLSQPGAERDPLETPRREVRTPPVVRKAK